MGIIHKKISGMIFEKWLKLFYKADTELTYTKIEWNLSFLKVIWTALHSNQLFLKQDGITAHCSFIGMEYDGFNFICISNADIYFLKQYHQK